MSCQTPDRMKTASALVTRKTSRVTNRSQDWEPSSKLPLTAAICVPSVPLRLEMQALAITYVNGRLAFSTRATFIK